jgi:hypothetical protein
MSIDLSIIGIVFAIILFIIFFAAIVLYLSFRIKETFREEKKKGFLIVKVGFLIGILFLAGGSFYFFAQILNPSPISVPESENTTDVIPPSEPDTSSNDTATSEPESSTDTTPPPTANETTDESGNPELNLILSYSSKIRMNTEFTMTFSITNPTEYVAHDVVLQTSSLFDYFSIISSTHTVTGAAIELGDISQGTTICSLTLLSSNQPSEVRETLILIFNEMTQQLTKDVSISITGGRT